MLVAPDDVREDLPGLLSSSDESPMEFIDEIGNRHRERTPPLGTIPRQPPVLYPMDPVSTERRRTRAVEHMELRLAPEGMGRDECSEVPASPPPARTGVPVERILLYPGAHPDEVDDTIVAHRVHPGPLHHLEQRLGGLANGHEQFAFCILGERMRLDEGDEIQRGGHTHARYHTRPPRGSRAPTTLEMVRERARRRWVGRMAWRWPTHRPSDRRVPGGANAP